MAYKNEVKIDFSRPGKPTDKRLLRIVQWNLPLRVSRHQLVQRSGYNSNQLKTNLQLGTAFSGPSTRSSYSRLAGLFPSSRPAGSKGLVSLTMATSVDDVTDQLLVDVFLGVAGEGSVANHSGSCRTPTCRSTASRKGASFTYYGHDCYLLLISSAAPAPAVRKKCRGS